MAQIESVSAGRAASAVAGWASCSRASEPRQEAAEAKREAQRAAEQKREAQEGAEKAGTWQFVEKQKSAHSDRGWSKELLDPSSRGEKAPAEEIKWWEQKAEGKRTLFPEPLRPAMKAKAN